MPDLPPKDRTLEEAADLLERHRRRLQDAEVAAFLETTRGSMPLRTRARIVSRVWYPISVQAVYERDTHARKEREEGAGE